MNKTLDDYAEEFLYLVQDSSSPIKGALRKLAVAVNCEETDSLYFAQPWLSFDDTARPWLLFWFLVCISLMPLVYVFQAW